MADILELGRSPGFLSPIIISVNLTGGAPDGKAGVST